MDNMPDYQRYSLEELYDVERRINREQYPERYAVLSQEILNRENDPANSRHSEEIRAGLNVFHLVGLLVLSLIVGGLSGRICGFAILFVGDYTGNSGTTGSEYVGYYDLSFAWWWAGWTGQPIGVICGPIAGFCAFGSETPLFKAWLLTMSGTLIGGCIGALSGPFAGLFFGLCGFVSGCMMMAALKDGTAT